jgi:CheY-like chemotaxis protein
MSIKVLVFESDSAFAGELRNELGNLGCAVRVVDDGNVGLQQAQAERPDLILLSIELPRMNGFSVCNKLKKDAALKEVPLIIMSSESSDETFEQHKKLRTRAEAYVHKPVAFGDLLQQIEAFVSISANALASTGDTGDPDGDGIMIDDGELDGSDPDREPESGRTAMFHVPTMPKHADRVDPDVDAFADDAFGRLQTSEPALPEAQPAPTPLPPSDPEPEPAPPPPSNQGTAAYEAADAEDADGAAAVGRAGMLERARAEAAAAAQQRDLATERARELEKQLLVAQGEVARIREEAIAEAERFSHDLEEARSRPPPVVAPATTKGASVPPKGVGGVSSREFLDLRETLSKKDKEILALKQQLAVKDKEIFETRERSLGHEGRVSELDDRILAKDRELAEAGEKIEDLSGQLETTTKGLSDTKVALDRLEKEHAALSEKRDQENVTHEAATAAAKADRAEAEKNLRETHAAAISKAEAAHKAEVASAEAAHTAAREQMESEHEAAAEQSATAHTAAMEEITAAHAAAMEETTAAHAAAMAEATRAHTSAMEEATRAYTTASEETARAHKAATEETAEAHAEALAEQKAEAERYHSETLAAREAELKSETDAKLASLHRSQQDELQRIRAEAETRETALKDDLEKATARGDDFEKQTASLTTVRATLEGQLGAAASKAIALEEELTAMREELDETRKNLVRESSRATRALAKWDADKASLERAKDALAVALSQLDEAEARQISE